MQTLVELSLDDAELQKELAGSRATFEKQLDEFVGEGPDLNFETGGADLNRRYVQFKAMLSTVNPLVSPVIKSAQVTAELFQRVPRYRNIFVVESDNPPIGIILTRNKDELLVEYATYEMNSQLFVQKYQLYLPDREELRRELELTLQIAEESANPEND